MPFGSCVENSAIAKDNWLFLCMFAGSTTTSCIHADWKSKTLWSTSKTLISQLPPVKFHDLVEQKKKKNKKDQRMRRERTEKKRLLQKPAIETGGNHPTRLQCVVTFDCIVMPSDTNSEHCDHQSPIQSTTLSSPSCWSPTTDVISHSLEPATQLTESCRVFPGWSTSALCVINVRQSSTVLIIHTCTRKYRSVCQSWDPNYPTSWFCVGFLSDAVQKPR